MLNRREFLSGAIGISILPLAASAQAARAPFVEVGDEVSFLYFEDWSRPFYPFGSLFVAAIGRWNGFEYPISLMKHDRVLSYFDGLDTEWSMLRREAGHYRHDLRFPNVHAFVRNLRYGEDPKVMREAMRLNRAAAPIPHGIRRDVETRQTVWSS